MERNMVISVWLKIIFLLLITYTTIIAQTVNLALHEADAPLPIDATFEWHNALPISSANLMTPTEIGSAAPGLYYGVFSFGTCYSAPTYLRVATNACPATTANLTTMVETAAIPAGMEISYHTSYPVTENNKITAMQASLATIGTYFVAYFDQTKSCYSMASPIIIANSTCSTLPIDLLNFSAKQIDDQVNLTWKTANEKEFSHFEIQRSADAKEFGTIGKVTGTKASIYNFVDYTPEIGVNYYRLKMVDLDGTSKLSNIINVSFENEGSYVTVENPANNGAFNVMTNLKNPRFALYSSMGAKVDFSSNKINEKGFIINSNLAAGLYYLNILTEGKTVTRKVIIP